MKELVMYIVKALVDNPDEVTVEETMQKDEIILKLKVSQDDVGKVIGKQGRIAKAIRTIMRAGAVRYNQKVMVEIDWRTSELNVKPRLWKVGVSFINRMLTLLIFATDDYPYSTVFTKNLFTSANGDLFNWL